MSTPDTPATRAITYNSDNMPVTITHSAHGTTNFTYDGGGARAKKSGPSGSTYYVGGHFEVNGSSEIKYIFAGSQRVAMIKSSGQIYYFHQDHLGSSAVLTDATGVKSQQTDYLPYGGQRGASAISATNYAFTGQEKDPETGLYNYNARLYDPAAAVFVTADSVVPNPMSSMAFHRYGYCGGNPLIYTDPSGHDFGASLAVAMIIGAAIGAGNAAIHGGDGWDMFGGAMTGAAMGAFSAGAFGAAGAACVGISNPIGQAAIHIAVGAFAGGMMSAMTGQNIGQGALIGALSAGFSKWAGESLGIEDIPNRATRYAAHMAVGGMAGGMGAVISGSDPFAAFGIGAAVAAVAYRFNHEGGLSANNEGEWNNIIDKNIEKINDVEAQRDLRNLLDKGQIRKFNLPFDKLAGFFIPSDNIFLDMTVQLDPFQGPLTLAHEYRHYWQYKNDVYWSLNREADAEAYSLGVTTIRPKEN
ncbi:MAG: RHS repeat-associated core domain-containing protein [Desulfobacterales bacterium]|nr:RHS repeat-associated core domain-containing protein [Desulfobacterales bacterium]